MIARDTYKSIPQPAIARPGAAAALEGARCRRRRRRLRPAERRQHGRAGEAAPGRHRGGAVRQGIQRAPPKNPRFFAHTIADEIHQQQRGLRGVARTKLTFTSDRDGERIKGPAASRDIQNIYIADYDGANETRITIPKSLDITPAWSPDAQAIAYTSYSSGYPDIIVAEIYKARNSRPAQRHRSHPQLPAGVVPRRHEARVHVEPRRQPRDLCGEPRRIGHAAADAPSRERRDADLGAERQPDRVHLEPQLASRRSGS